MTSTEAEGPRPSEHSSPAEELRKAADELRHRCALPFRVGGFVNEYDALADLLEAEADYWALLPDVLGGPGYLRPREAAALTLARTINGTPED